MSVNTHTQILDRPTRRWSPGGPWYNLTMAGEPARSLDDAHVLALEQLSKQIDRPRRFTYSTRFWDCLTSLHQQHGISLLAASSARRALT